MTSRTPLPSRRRLKIFLKMFSKRIFTRRGSSEILVVSGIPDLLEDVLQFVELLVLVRTHHSLLLVLTVRRHREVMGPAIIQIITLIYLLIVPIITH